MALLESVPLAQPEAEAHAEVEGDTEALREAEPEREPDFDAVAQPVAVPEREPDLDAEAQPVVVPEREPDPDTVGHLEGLADCEPLREGDSVALVVFEPTKRLVALSWGPTEGVPLLEGEAPAAGDADAHDAEPHAEGVDDADAVAQALPLRDTVPLPLAHAVLEA